MSKFIRLNVMLYDTINGEWCCSEQLINVDSILRVYKENERRSVIVTTEINGNTTDTKFNIKNKYHTINMTYEELCKLIFDVNYD